MTAVFTLAPKEDWIVDRFVQEWTLDNPDMACHDPQDADLIWLMADWCWLQVPIWILSRKKVVVTVHHVVPQKFDLVAYTEFVRRDQLVTAYHVPNEHTRDVIKAWTKKPIHVIPYWANQRIWRPTGTKEELRKKHGLPIDGYLVGSFQRDTEGNDLKTPKLEKGPDLLADALITFKPLMPNLHVVLAGWRRQYLISRLEAASIPYSYVEKPPQETVNELYQTLDLYPVTARQEGGPQSIIECGLLNVPVVSRDVGMASMCLPREAINDTITQCFPAIPDVTKLRLPYGYAPYKDLFRSIVG